MVGLPHARGGVSISSEDIVIIKKSSPRPWGCFQKSWLSSWVKPVFPTPVGVFLFWELVMSQYTGLPHARGGVSSDLLRPSRPDIAKEVLARLENGVLKADEVLPNPNSPANKDRAYLVLKDIGHENDKNKRGATVVEVSANGKGIDVVSSMTGDDRSLKKARNLKKIIETARSEGQQLDSKPSNSPHLALPGQDQAHAAADFPKLNQVLDESINQTPVNAIKNESPEITAARESIPDIPADKLFEIEHDDGSTDTGTAAELMARADEEAAFADQADTATSSAITCFLKFGDL